MLRPVQQQHGAEGEHAGAGLEPADEDTVGEAGEVDVADRVALVADEVAEQTVPGPESLPGGGLEQEATRLGDGPEDPLAAVRDVEPGRHERPEVGPVLVGKPEQLTDHEERHRERELPDQVHLGAVRLHGGEATFDDLPDRGAQAFQAPHRELRA